jgi:dihydrofolate reductase
MPQLRAHNIAISLDGYMAGPNQSLEHGLGEGGEELHTWYFADNKTAVEQRYFDVSFEGIGANIMGRNMFGPIRGDWGDDDWTGWWGDDPPYHSPVYVLTHHAHDPIEMQGGTTFHFVTDGIQSAYDQAFAAAGGQDVRLNGGASTIQQYLAADLVDVLNVAIAPILLGGGERLFAEPGYPTTGWECVEMVSTGAGLGVTHVQLERRR